MNDSQDIIICPACGTEMKKVFIDRLNLNIDICSDGCGAIFFDNREFDKFNEQCEDVTEILAELENKDFKTVDKTAKRVCPACGSIMVKNFASVKKEVEVDCCYVCGARFLDNSELTKIRSQYKTEKERSIDFNRYLLGFIKTEMDELNQECAQRAAERSSLKRLFDKCFEEIRHLF